MGVESSESLLWHLVDVAEMDGFPENATLEELKLFVIFLALWCLVTPTLQQKEISSFRMLSYVLDAISLRSLNFSFKISLFCSTREPRFYKSV